METYELLELLRAIRNTFRLALRITSYRPVRKQFWTCPKLLTNWTIRAVCIYFVSNSSSSYFIRSVRIKFEKFEDLIRAVRISFEHFVSLS